MPKKINITKEKFLLFAQAAIGGILSGISLSQGSTFMMPFGIALLWSVSSVPFWSFIWGLIAVLLSHKWLLDLHPLSWIGVPDVLSLPIAIGIWLFCGISGAVLVGTWSFLLSRFKSLLVKDDSLKFRFLNALALSILWGLGEVLLAQTPLFWIGIGTSLLPGDRLLAGLAQIVGAGGLCAIQLIIGWWVWQLATIYKRKMQWIRLFLIGLIYLLLGHTLGWYLLTNEINSESFVVAMWQSNIPIREKFSKDKIYSIPYSLKSSLDKAKDLGADLLVAPEGTLLLNQKLISPAPINFLTGGFRSINGLQRSSLLAINAGNVDYSFALDKYRLVPLGEWLPNLPGFSSFSLSAVGGIYPGESSRLFLWDGPPLAVAICYEISDGTALAKAALDGGRWFLALANLDPYPISLQKQFLALSQLRSIENNRDLVIVSNTGPTSLVKNTGKVQFILPPFEEDIGLATVNLNRYSTFYSKFRETTLLILLSINIGSLYHSRLKNRA